jgi:murein DD-endopeptidase MepM/ murein hydrolase activator NlpD
MSAPLMHLEVATRNLRLARHRDASHTGFLARPICDTGQGMRERARRGGTTHAAWVVALYLGGCGGDAAPSVRSPSKAAQLEGPAHAGTDSPTDTPPATPPPPPGAFDLPGLRDWAPSDRLGWPTESVHITSSYGWRVDPVSGQGTRLHRGIDLRGTPGDLVLSIGAGTVEFAGHDPLLGNLVIVDHGQGLESFYGHLSDVLVAADVEVERGAAIGLVGNTGRSAAPHLHLSVRLDGVPIDPLEVIGEPLHRPSAAATRLADLEPDLEPTAPLPEAPDEPRPVPP